MSTIVLVCTLLSACFTLPLDKAYQGPPTRPEELQEYYNPHHTYTSFKEELLVQKQSFDLKKILIETPEGQIQITYYQRKEKSRNIILVFPLLGGKNVIVDYFANYFAHHGYDAAIIHRNDDFKDPKFFEQLEELFRKSVIRDRLAMDFFEQQYGKTEFGSFGISRGAINVVISAGADPRLKYNVIAMGGTNLAKTFRDSNQKRIKKYVRTIMAQKKMTAAQFYDYLALTVRTDPKRLAQYLDARHTLLFLALLDRTVPIQYGLKLRRQIGKPKTVFMVADHYLSFLFSGIRKILPRPNARSIVAFDYIEAEAMSFYDQMFKHKDTSCRLIPIHLIQFPFSLIARIVDNIF